MPMVADEDTVVAMTAWGDQSDTTDKWRSLSEPGSQVKSGQLGSGGLHRKGRNYIPVAENVILNQRLNKGVAKSKIVAYDKPTENDKPNEYSKSRDYSKPTTKAPPKYLPKNKKPPGFVSTLSTPSAPSTTAFSHTPSTQFSRPDTRPPRTYGQSATVQPPPSTIRPPPQNATWGAQNLVDVPFWKDGAPFLPTILSRDTKNTTSGNSSRPATSTHNTTKPAPTTQQNRHPYNQQERATQPHSEKYTESSNQYHNQDKIHNGNYNKPRNENHNQNHTPPPHHQQHHQNSLWDTSNNGPVQKPDWLDQKVAPPTKPTWVDRKTPVAKPTWLEAPSWHPPGFSPSSYTKNPSLSNPRLSSTEDQPNPVVVTIHIELEDSKKVMVPLRMQDDPERMARDFAIKHQLVEPSVRRAILALFKSQKELAMQKRRGEVQPRT
ncbi:hypothetical protein BDF14DRAFT_1774647 [Spinellus fusiger]|nr:hypothetical protein BDF14DRAFT_1774647 [Spinellus fusiger]